MSKELGLSTAEVQASRLKHGRNILTPPEREPLWRKFVEKFRDPIIVILLVAMVLSLAVSCYEYYVVGLRELTLFLEPLGVLLAVLLATGVAFYFEVRSEREFEVLNQVNDEVYYKVYRDGHITQVLKTDIVVGDVIELETGEEIPADGALIEAISLQVDESTLTGEPLVSKNIQPTPQEIEEATYAPNYLCRGTTILDGHCIYRVDKVGDSTEYGSVFEGAQIDDSVTTPLNAQLNRLASIITKVSYAIAALVLLGSLLVYAIEGHFSPFEWSHALGYFLQKVMIAVTVIVVAVPEGLPMSVTLSLAYSMRSMMRTNNLVRRMHACETMGAATVICTDKTGTLTQNRMTVADHAFAPEYEGSELIRLSVALNATAHLDRTQPGTPKVLGNPTEGALLLWLYAQGSNYEELRDTYPIIDQLSFSTERKYMATLVSSGQGKYYLLVKGAPEIVMQMTTITPEAREWHNTLLTGYQKRAMRTIGFAYAALDALPHNATCRELLATTPLSFMGIVAISDPIRPEVPEAIRRCMEAKIQVKIVTGDTSGTAQEIGRQIGLWDDSCGDECLITGAEFAAMSDEALLERVQSLRIMSRARPMDKERLVRLLQQCGEVVAVTGDGTNDAPALNRAHVGLSMGDGTAVAKEASDITILDNSFASITQAVMWGRSLYRNIQRFILFQMTINVAACLIVLIGAFIGSESPLTVTQMLWVNLIMDTFAALALASLPPSEEVLQNPPRHTKAHIITKAMAQRIFGLGSFFVLLLFGLIQYFKHAEVEHILDFEWSTAVQSLGNFSPGTLSGYELTLLFSIFVFLQWWNLFNARVYRSSHSALSGLDSCRNFVMISLAILLGQIVITTLGGEMFRAQPLDITSWIVIIAATSVVLWGGMLKAKR